MKERWMLYLDDLFAESWDWLVVGKIESLEVIGPKAQLEVMGRRFEA